MATDIQEIPLDIVDNAPEIEDSVPNITGSEEVAEVVPEERPKPKAKPKGRPKGAPNKGPSKPRVKRATIQEEPASPPYEPSSPRSYRISDVEAMRPADVAVEMLRLLQKQTQSRQQRKKDLYASWFT
jgi:hypothetical protein